jgi:hypothetical protein
MSSLKTPTEQPFASGGGIQVAPTPVEDPYTALDALMSVIEALCPTWPQRRPFLSGGAMLL